MNFFVIQNLSFFFIIIVGFQGWDLNQWFSKIRKKTRSNFSLFPNYFGIFYCLSLCFGSLGLNFRLPLKSISSLANLFYQFQSLFSVRSALSTSESGQKRDNLQNPLNLFHNSGKMKILQLILLEIFFPIWETFRSRFYL